MLYDQGPPGQASLDEGSATPPIRTMLATVGGSHVEPCNMKLAVGEGDDKLAPLPQWEHDGIAVADGFARGEC